MSVFAFCPTKNKVVAGLGYSCDNRGHRMTLLLKIQANFKISTVSQNHCLFTFFHAMTSMWLEWLSCGWFRFRLHTHTLVNLAKSTCWPSTCMYNFLTWAPQKSTGRETIYYTGKNTGKHEKILSGQQCFVKSKMEDKSYFFSCCKLRI